MTTTLAHPPAEDLGRFTEGTLDDAGRAAVVEHIADCDDCRIIVVDATAFGEESEARSRVAGRRWMAIAATVVLAVSGGALIVNARLDPLTPAKEVYAGLSSRPVEARLNGFSYIPRHSMRSGEQEEDPAALPLQAQLANIIDRQGNSAKSLHAVGVAYLIDASLAKLDPQASAKERQDAVDSIRSERAKAVRSLQAAADAEPENVKYRSDFAAALIATGDDENLHRAVAACDQALNIDKNFPDALFNRAISLRVLHDDRATRAFQRYLEVDPSSKWADEARDQLEFLKLTPP